MPAFALTEYAPLPDGFPNTYHTYIYRCNTQLKDGNMAPTWGANMSGFESDMLLNNYLTFNIIVLVTGFLSLFWLTRWIHVAVGFIIGVPLLLMISAMTTAAYLVEFTGGDAIDGLMADPQAGGAFLLEGGIEFGLPGILLALLALAISKLVARRSQRSNTPTKPN